MKKSEINSIEIARLAGVSRSTVSRVVNNYANVPSETKEKVMKIITQYNYVPNVSAQVLAGKKTRTLGFFLIETGRGSDDILTNMLIASTIENASFANYYVLTNIVRDKSNIDSIRSIKEIFYQRRIDGGIFIGAANGEPFIEELIAEGFMIAAIDQNIPGRQEPNRIVANFDTDKGMMLAMSYLCSLGHTQVGCIKGNMMRYSGQTKFAGFMNGMRDHNLNVRNEWILQGGFSEKSGYNAIIDFMKKSIPLPTAMIMANDSVAFGAIRAFNEFGIRVPEDISIIGYDDHALSSRMTPALTTIRVDFQSMIKETVHTLIQHIEKGSAGFTQLMTNSQLIERASCKQL